MTTAAVEMAAPHTATVVAIGAAAIEAAVTLRAAMGMAVIATVAIGEAGMATTADMTAPA